MNVLLLSGGAKIGCQPIVEVLRELEPHGVVAHVALWAPITPELADADPAPVIWGPRRIQRETNHEIAGTTDATDFSGAEREVSASEVPAGARGLTTSRIRAAYAWRMLRLRKALRPYWGPLRARVARVLGRPIHALHARRCWRLVSRDPQVLQWAREAEVIIAMDAQAVLASWQLSRQLPAPDVVFGLSAGRGQVLRRLAV